MKKRCLAGLVLVGSLLLPAAASADCLSVELRIWTTGSSTPSRPIGQKRCVTGTPWNESIIKSNDVWVTGLPNGTPNGAGVTVWLPLP